MTVDPGSARVLRGRGAPPSNCNFEAVALLSLFGLAVQASAVSCCRCVVVREEKEVMCV